MIPNYKRLLHSFGLYFTKSDSITSKGLSVILFSKDRPMQLDALLTSIRHCFIGDYQLILQWYTSNSEFENAYEEVLHKHNDIIYKNIKEKQFREDLIGAIEQAKSSNLMFLVDDILFVNQFDTNWLNNINLKKVVPSIRLWSGINYTQPSDLVSMPPKINLFSIKPWYVFSWTESSGYWSMPLSVDGNVFDKKEILFMLKRTEFKAPNTLEKAFGPYRFMFKYRKGICLAKPIILNFALNRVNVENNDFACGEEYTSEKLLNLWNSGYRIDVKAMQRIKSNSCHLICDPIFMDSKNIYS